MNNRINGYHLGVFAGRERETGFLQKAGFPESLFQPEES